MLTNHRILQTKNSPSAGLMNANIQGEKPFATEVLNLANDFYTPDKKMRLTLSSLLILEDTSSRKVMHGIEMVFDDDLGSGTYRFEDKRVAATFWKILAENGETLYQSYGADTGSVELKFSNSGGVTDDINKEIVNGTFSFKSIGPGDTVLEIVTGEFFVMGRDDFTL